MSSRHLLRFVFALLASTSLLSGCGGSPEGKLPDESKPASEADVKKAIDDVKANMGQLKKKG